MISSSRLLQRSLLRDKVRIVPDDGRLTYLAERNSCRSLVIRDSIVVERKEVMQKSILIEGVQAICLDWWVRGCRGLARSGQAATAALFVR
jgi:hypothetical protein